jgi:hypothetical protein
MHFPFTGGCSTLPFLCAVFCPAFSNFWLKPYYTEKAFIPRKLDESNN